MEGTLRVTPQVLKQTADGFSSKNSEIKNITTEMVDIVTKLSAVWEGEASTAYTAKIKGLKADMDRMSSMITEHVTDLTDMATTYETAEQANIEAGNSLTASVIS